jgi:Prealbumin-like fold domain
LLFLIVYASVARSDSKAGNTGITGVILVAPIRPGPVKKGSESPNTAPLPKATFSVSRDEKAVTTFTTDAEGRFKVLLEPGHYVVSLAENRFPKPCGPFQVDVEAGKMTDVEWRCDSGMR